MTSSAFNAMVDAEPEYFNALFDIRDNPRWVHNIVQNPSTLAFFRWAPSATPVITEVPEIVDTLVAQDDYMNLIITSPRAIIAVASSEYMKQKIQATPSAKAIYATASDAVMTEALVTIAALSGSYPDMASIANDPTAMAVIAASSTAMVAIAASDIGVVLMLNNSLTLNAMMALSAAKESIWGSSVAINHIINTIDVYNALLVMATTLTVPSAASNSGDYIAIAGKSLVFNGRMTAPHSSDPLVLKGIAGASGSGNFTYPLNISSVIDIQKTFDNCSIAQQTNSNAITLTYLDMN
jgi:hypothetical protein